MLAQTRLSFLCYSYQAFVLNRHQSVNEDAWTDRLTAKPMFHVLLNETAAFDSLLQKSNDWFLESTDFLGECLEIAYECKRVFHTVNQAHNLCVGLENMCDQLYATGLSIE